MDTLTMLVWLLAGLNVCFVAAILSLIIENRNLRKSLAETDWSEYLKAPQDDN